MVALPRRSAAEPPCCTPSTSIPRSPVTRGPTVRRSWCADCRCAVPRWTHVRSLRLDQGPRRPRRRVPGRRRHRRRGAPRTTTSRPPSRSSRSSSGTRATTTAPRTPDTVERTLRLVRWGLVPSWAKDPKGGARMINARSESRRAEARVPPRAERAALPDPGRRLVRVAARRRTHKQPVLHPLPDGARSRWPGCGSTGSRRTTRRASTRTAWSPRRCSPPRRRRPAAPRCTTGCRWCCRRRRWDAWLDPDVDADDDAGRRAARARRRRSCVAAMELRPVSPVVNNVRNNGPELLGALRPRTSPSRCSSTCSPGRTRRDRGAAAGRRDPVEVADTRTGPPGSPCTPRPGPRRAAARPRRRRRDRCAGPARASRAALAAGLPVALRRAALPGRRTAGPGPGRASSTRPGSRSSARPRRAPRGPPLLCSAAAAPGPAWPAGPRRTGGAVGVLVPGVPRAPAGPAGQGPPGRARGADGPGAGGAGRARPVRPPGARARPRGRVLARRPLAEGRPARARRPRSDLAAARPAPTLPLTVGPAQCARAQRANAGDRTTSAGGDPQRGQQQRAGDQPDRARSAAGPATRAAAPCVHRSPAAPTRSGADRRPQPLGQRRQEGRRPIGHGHRASSTNGTADGGKPSRRPAPPRTQRYADVARLPPRSPPSGARSSTGPARARWPAAATSHTG